jgi:hypothetical protein
MGIARQRAGVAAACLTAVLAIVAPRGTGGQAIALLNGGQNVVVGGANATATVCVQGTGFDAVADKVIVTPAGTTCGTPTATVAGNAFLTCSSTGAECGGTPALACPNLTDSSLLGGGAIPGVSVANLSDCFASGTDVITGTRHTILPAPTSGTSISDGGNDST